MDRTKTNAFVSADNSEEQVMCIGSYIHSFEEKERRMGATRTPVNGDFLFSSKIGGRPVGLSLPLSFRGWALTLRWCGTRAPKMWHDTRCCSSFLLFKRLYWNLRFLSHRVKSGTSR